RHVTCTTLSANTSACQASLSNPHPALFPHELLDVVRAAGPASRRAAGLPPAERIDPGPRPCRRAGASVHVGDARLDAIEELLNLAVVFGEDAGCQPVLGTVGEIDGFVDGHDVADD